jgi:hypothetical protein
MVHELEGGPLQATLLNFSALPVEADVTSPFLPPGATVTDAATGRAIAVVAADHSIRVRMEAHQGLFVLFDDHLSRPRQAEGGGDTR